MFVCVFVCSLFVPEFVAPILNSGHRRHGPKYEADFDTRYSEDFALVYEVKVYSIQKHIVVEKYLATKFWLRT